MATAMIGSVNDGVPRPSPSASPLADVSLGQGSAVMFPESVDVDGGTVAVVVVDEDVIGGMGGNGPPPADDVVGSLDELVEDAIVSLGSGQSPPPVGTAPLAEADAETLPPPPPLALVVCAAAPPAKTRHAVNSNTKGVANLRADIRKGEFAAVLKRDVGRPSKGSTDVLRQKTGKERATTPAAGA